MKFRLLGILSLLVLVLALTACDGSSGSSSATGAVAAAPMQLAKVYGLSAEGAKVLIGTTDSSGEFAINSNAEKLQFPAVVWSVSGWNVNDNPTDASKEFKGTLKGVMTSSDSAVYLTPANSLVAAFFEKTGNLSEAQEQVKSLLKNEMGLTISNPLGNPLADLNQSEFAAKALMHMIGAGSENNEAAMEVFIQKIDFIAEAMSMGSTFSAVLQKMPESPYFGHTDALSVCVLDELEAILKEANDSLRGNAANLDKIRDNVTVVDTTGYPIALNFNGLSSSEKAPADIGTFTTTFQVEVARAGVTALTAHYVKVVSLVNGKLSYDGSPIPDDYVTPFTADPTKNFTFEVELDADVALPYTASFTLETAEIDDTMPTFSRTYTVTFIGLDEFAVKEVTYKGDDLFAFATPSTVDGKIAKDATAVGTFAADVELVNSIDESLVDGNMDVRFIAPAGLAFNDSSENSDIVTVGSFTKSGTTYTATPGAAYNFIAKTDVDAGFKTVRIQVLDQDGETIAQTAKDIVFVPEDQKDNLTRANLIAQTLTPAVPSDGKYAPTSIKLAGTYKTWVKEADADATEGVSALPVGSKVILMSTTGAKVFEDEVGTAVDSLAIDVNVTENFEFTADVTNFIYNYSIANDDIKMIFMLDSEDTNNNIESSNVLKLRFVAP